MQSQQLPFSIRQRLGHAPDQELANEANCTLRAIMSARVALGIPAQAHDSASGVQNASSVPAVGTEECDRPVATYQPQPAATEKRTQSRLSQDVIDALGTMPDRELARQTGKAESTIRTARTARGIDPFASRRNLNESVIAALGTMPDCKLARIAGRSESSIRTARSRRGIAKFINTVLEVGATLLTQAELIAQLGTKSDNELAKLSGKSISLVRHMRRMRGIERYKPSEAVQQKYTEPAALSGLVVPDLCQKTSRLLTWANDKHVQRVTGMDIRTINKLRRTHQIPNLRLRLEPPIGLIEALESGSTSELAYRFRVSTGYVEALKQKLRFFQAQQTIRPMMNTRPKR